MMIWYKEAGSYMYDAPIQMKVYITRQSEMANTSPCHMPVLGNVHPIKIEKFDIFFVTSFLCSLEFLYYLFYWATQEVPMKNI